MKNSKGIKNDTPTNMRALNTGDIIHIKEKEMNIQQMKALKPYTILYDSRQMHHTVLIQVSEVLEVS